MKNPQPVTLLALRLASIPPQSVPDLDARAIGITDATTSLAPRTQVQLACDATRICEIAKQVRRLAEASCDTELTVREEKRLESLLARGNDLLKPYGLEMNNPLGLCFYACPIGHYGSTQSTCTFLA